MSDAREPEGSEESDRPDGPWWTGEDEVGGIGFARFFAYTGLLMSIASLVIALVAPLEGDALRTVWITGFAATSMWIAFMAAPRYRREGMRVSPAVPITMVLGVLTIAIMVYAFTVIALASTGVVLPAPAYWFGGEVAPSGVNV
ncbi:hypothetical protein JOE59_000029 [Agromyces cerinus]|uniref:hypothetical protein n=1 Tax=Agromyces cerinus TaxID=33878 RepID=UPI00195B668D|nr:hypothetical protein [Agromyces cerinus]MBM7829324.1 hypothetical protein [Agromyces cerinus]